MLTPRSSRACVKNGIVINAKQITLVGQKQKKQPQGGRMMRREMAVTRKLTSYANQLGMQILEPMKRSISGWEGRSIDSDVY